MSHELRRELNEVRQEVVALAETLVFVGAWAWSLLHRR
jgi:hypothetical protein